MTTVPNNLDKEPEECGMVRVVDIGRGRPARAMNKGSYMMVGGKWKALCHKRHLIVRILLVSTMARAIRVGLVRSNFASISVSSLLHHFLIAIALLGLWGPALRVTALVMLMMSQLFARDPQDVSLFSCLDVYQQMLLVRLEFEQSRKLTVVALSNPVLYPSPFSQV